MSPATTPAQCPMRVRIGLSMGRGPRSRAPRLAARANSAKRAAPSSRSSGVRAAPPARRRLRPSPPAAASNPARALPDPRRPCGARWPAATQTRRRRSTRRPRTCRGTCARAAARGAKRLPPAGARRPTAEGPAAKQRSSGASRRVALAPAEGCGTSTTSPAGRSPIPTPSARRWPTRARGTSRSALRALLGRGRGTAGRACRASRA
mmetsp:Transcript_40759/g.96933  ORF Transcript_40759/g.96933 Transcript_40759/m.96933 type:complete len:207 (-) Transcript_40759:48-668(-)